MTRVPACLVSLLVTASAACASAPAAAPTPREPSVAAPAVVADDAWSAFDATAARYMRALVDELHCAAPDAGMEPWCVIGAGWATGQVGEIPDGQHILAGVSLAFAPGEPTTEAFKRPLALSVAGVRSAGSERSIHLVFVRPESPEEEAEATQAMGFFYGFLIGKTPGIRLTGGLAKWADGLRTRAGQPTEPGPRGTRFVQPDGTRGELRHVDKYWVVLEQPPGADGVMLTVLTEFVQLEP